MAWIIYVIVLLSFLSVQISRLNLAIKHRILSSPLGTDISLPHNSSTALDAFTHHPLFSTTSRIKIYLVILFYSAPFVYSTPSN